MRRINLYVCIALLISLFAAFSQAASIKGVDCSHCNKQLFSQPECCSMPGVVRGAGDCHSSERDAETCPHGGLCQAGDAIPMVVTTTVAPDVIVASFYSEEQKSVCPIIAGNHFEIRSIPLPRSPSIFLLHCSFLI